MTVDSAKIAMYQVGGLGLFRPIGFTRGPRRGTCKAPYKSNESVFWLEQSI